jgi:hypothetical protein
MNLRDGIDGLAGGGGGRGVFLFFLVFAYYGQSGWAVANLVVAAASMGFVLPFANFILDTTFTLFRRLIRRDLHPGRSWVRIALMISVTVGIAGGGLWVWGKEPRTVANMTKYANLTERLRQGI